MKWLIKINKQIEHKVSIQQIKAQHYEFEVNIDNINYLVIWQKKQNICLIRRKDELNINFFKVVHVSNYTSSYDNFMAQDLISIFITKFNFSHNVTITMDLPWLKNLKSQKSNKEIIIKSPITGKIINVISQLEPVKKGDVILTIDAMKMENKIVASCSGVLKKIFVKQGDSVKVGENLVLLNSF